MWNGRGWNYLALVGLTSVLALVLSDLESRPGRIDIRSTWWFISMIALYALLPLSFSKLRNYGFLYGSVFLWLSLALVVRLMHVRVDVFSVILAVALLYHVTKVASVRDEPSRIP
jgi:hypothetical protein